MSFLKTNSTGHLERQSVRGEVERPTIIQERVVRREVRERRRRVEVRRCRGAEARAPSMHPAGGVIEELEKNKVVDMSSFLPLKVK